MNRTFRAALVVSAATAILAGCSQKDPGTPTPETRPTGATTTATSKSGSSGNPVLDISKYVESPCDILKPDQAASLGTFRETKAEQSASGPSCTWQGTDVLDNSTYKIIFVTNGSTIENIIENSRNNKTFHETSISGYQAVSTDSTDAARACNTAVGTSDEDAVFIQASIAKNDTANVGKACAATERVATTVIANLKG